MTRINAHREVRRYLFGVALLLPVSALASKAECRAGDRVVPCALVEECVALGGVLRDHEGALMCCFADERCTEAGSLSKITRPRPEPPHLPSGKEPAMPRPRSGR